MIKLSSGYNKLKRIIGDTPRHRATEVDAIRQQNQLLLEQVQLLRDSQELQSEMARSLKSMVHELALNGRRTVANQESFRRLHVAVENIRMASMSPLRAEMRESITSHQLGLLETVELIRDQRLSFSRYGDGEFRLMFRPEFDLRFQKNTPQLAHDLREVLSNPADKTLLGLPHIFYDVHWSTVLAELWHEISPLIPSDIQFGDAHVSRPPMFTLHGNEGVEAWRSVWAGRDVAVVAGKGSRFDLIDELFGSVASSTMVYSKPTGAYDDLDRVTDAVLESGRDMVLIALGPTGTILANNLAKRGVQALDIGHLTASYRAVFEGASQPESRPLTTQG